ncbi:DNA/RNA non-specific endonuclease [Paenibacillus sp. FSL H7-0756]
MLIVPNLANASSNLPTSGLPEYPKEILDGLKKAEQEAKKKVETAAPLSAPVKPKNIVKKMSLKGVSTLQSTPTISVSDVTEYSLNINVTYPIDGQFGNGLAIQDQTTMEWKDVYGSYYAKTGTYKVTGLIPGRSYAAQMYWYTDDTHSWTRQENFAYAKTKTIAPELIVMRSSSTSLIVFVNYPIPNQHGNGLFLLDHSTNTWSDIGKSWSVSSGFYEIYDLKPNTIYTIQQVWYADSTSDWNRHEKLITLNTSYGDTEAPSAPTGLVSETFDYTNVYLSWNAATDNVGIKQYNIYNGDSLIGVTPNTNFLVPNISVPSINRFKVKAVDEANNISLASNISIIDFSDTTRPTTPTNLAYRDVKLNSVTLYWTPSTDSSGISKYIIHDQKTGKAYISTEPKYTINDLKSSSTYSYAVTAFDLLGNRSHTSEVLQVTTDGYINKSIEVIENGLLTNEGPYNARTYQNGKTFVMISGLSGDVDVLVEGNDYIKEGTDYWYSTNYLSQRMNVTVTGDKVVFTSKPVAPMDKVNSLSVTKNVYNITSVSESVYSLTSVSTFDDIDKVKKMYAYLDEHPDFKMEQVQEYYESILAKENSRSKITEINEDVEMNAGSFNTESISSSGSYDPDEFDPQLNPQELALMNDNYDNASGSIWAGFWAYAYSLSEFDKNELTDGNGDAFRHAFWGALMVVETNYNWAGRWGTAHELGEPNNPEDQKIMDLYNNFAGRMIGLKYVNSLNGKPLPLSIFYMPVLRDEVLRALDNGELKRIDNEPMFTSQTQAATFNSLNTITPMGATINPYDNIEMSAKHMKTDTTGKKTSTQQAPAGMVHIRTYLSINRFKNGWGQVQFVGNNQLTIRAWINNTFTGKTYEDITIPMEMTLYKAGYFATPQSIKAALAKYFEKKKNSGIYVRQWGAESSGTFYKVDGMSQFNVFGGNRNGSSVDINTFINSMGPLWETEYLAYTNSDALRDLQKSLDLISVFPLVGVVAGSGSIIISFVSGNTKDAALAAGFTAAGPVIGKFTNYAGSAILRVYNSTKVNTILQKAGSSISNLKSAIKNTSSDLNSLITNVYSGYNGRIELEFADVGRMNFNQAQLIEGTNEVAQARYKNFLETKWAETTPQINTTYEDAMTGQHFTKSGRIKVLKASTTYKVNGYTYSTDNLGRIAKVEGDLVLKAAPRNEYAQGIVGRQDRVRELDNPDVGGHLIASSFNGSGELDNLVAMNAQINGASGKWYKMEEDWRKALQSNGSVNVKIMPIYSAISQRPSSFEVIYKINNVAYPKVTILNQVGG